MLGTGSEALKGQPAVEMIATPFVSFINDSMPSFCNSWFSFPIYFRVSYQSTVCIAGDIVEVLDFRLPDWCRLFVSFL